MINFVGFALSVVKQNYLSYLPYFAFSAASISSLAFSIARAACSYSASLSSLYFCIAWTFTIVLVTEKVVVAAVETIERVILLAEESTLVRLLFEVRKLSVCYFVAS